MKASVTITIDVDTTMDLHTLEARLETLIDPEAFEQQLLGDESCTFIHTTIDAQETPPPDPVIEPPLHNGEAVELLVYWAHGSAPTWMKGYSFDRYTTAQSALVVHTDGPFQGASVREVLTKIRRARA